MPLKTIYFICSWLLCKKQMKPMKWDGGSMIESCDKIYIFTKIGFENLVLSPKITQTVLWPLNKTHPNRSIPSNYTQTLKSGTSTFIFVLNI